MTATISFPEASMTSSFNRESPPLLIVSMKMLRTFLPALREKADSATRPIALAWSTASGVREVRI